MHRPTSGHLRASHHFTRHAPWPGRSSHVLLRWLPSLLPKGLSFLGDFGLVVSNRQLHPDDRPSKAPSVTHPTHFRHFQNVGASWKLIPHFPCDLPSECPEHRRRVGARDCRQPALASYVTISCTAACRADPPLRIDFDCPGHQVRYVNRDLHYSLYLPPAQPLFTCAASSTLLTLSCRGISLTWNGTGDLPLSPSYSRRSIGCPGTCSSVKAQISREMASQISRSATIMPGQMRLPAPNIQ